MSKSVVAIGACFAILSSKAMKLIAVLQVRRNETPACHKRLGLIKRGTLFERADGDLGATAGAPGSQGRRSQVCHSDTDSCIGSVEAYSAEPN